jgi:hypothetical protein
MHPGAEGAAPEVKTVVDLTEEKALKGKEMRIMVDQALDAALDAQRALAAEREKNAALAVELATLARERTEAQQLLVQAEAHKREQQLPKAHSCENCGLASSPTSTTHPCCIPGCSNWAHAGSPCGMKSPDGAIQCHSCFAKLCNAFYTKSSSADSVTADLADLRSDASGTLADQPKSRGPTKYTFSNALVTPKSPQTWFSCLQVRNQTPIHQGTITADGVQIHAFTSIIVSKKVTNIAVVTPTTADLERTASSVMISWLNLEPKSLRFNKCAKYAMPPAVADTINSPTILRPRANPFAAKKKRAITVLSGDDAETDHSSGSDTARRGDKKRNKLEAEVRELRKQLKQQSEAIAAAATAAAAAAAAATAAKSTPTSASKKTDRESTGKEKQTTEPNHSGVSGSSLLAFAVRL